MLEFNIRNQEISRIDNFSPAEKSVEYLIAKFNFKTEDWNGAIKRAIFRNVKSKVEKDAMLEDDSCIVPWEVLVGSSDIEVSVHGVIGTEEITTDVVAFNLNRTLQGGSASQEPSPTVYEQMLKEMQETKEIAQSVRDDADNGEFNGPQGPQGEPGVIEYILCTKLPTENIKNAIYLLKRSDSEDGNLYDEYIYTNGAWELLGSKPVKLDLSNYVTFDDTPTNVKAGAVKVSTPNGTGVNGYGQLKVVPATDSEIRNRGSARKPIVPTTLDLAVQEGLANSQIVWTDEEKAKARDLLGVTELVGDVQTILTELHAHAETLVGGEA